MTTSKTLYLGLFLIPLLLIYPGSSFSQALGLMGPVNEINGHFINVMDTTVTISPTVKVFSKDGTKMSLSDIRPGDMVSLQTMKLNGRIFADTITIIKK